MITIVFRDPGHGWLDNPIWIVFHTLWRSKPFQIKNFMKEKNSTSWSRYKVESCPTRDKNKVYPTETTIIFWWQSKLVLKLFCKFIPRWVILSSMSSEKLDYLILTEQLIGRLSPIFLPIACGSKLVIFHIFICWSFDEPRSHAAKSHNLCDIKYEKKKRKITRDKLGSAENRENVACMKSFGETDVLEQ